MARKLVTQLARLIPESIEVKSGDRSVIVAGNADENRILNYFLAAQIRDLLESNVAIYKSMEKPLTPKELKDLADAGRSLAEYSATIYKEGEPLHPAEQKADAPSDIPNFGSIDIKPVETQP